MFKFILFTFILSMSQFAYSYPNFIGKGYNNCLTCHYNPFGNGPLNAYGRGVAATALAGRLFVSDKTTDEQLSNRSGFLFNKADKTLIQPSLDYRGAMLRTGVDQKEPINRWITMQMDAALSAEWGARKEWVATYTYSVIPDNTPSGIAAAYGHQAGEEVEITYSREHYIGYKVTPSLGLYLGKMDKVFGIRVPDHTAYARYATSNDQHGATHGVLVHYGKEKFDLGLHAFIGDLEKEEEYQGQGFSTKFEYSIGEKTRLGVSYLTEKSDQKETDAQSILAKMGIGKGSSLMAELGTSTNATQTTQQYFFLQNHFYIKRGLWFITTYEQLMPDTTTTEEQHRFAPGVLYMPFQRLEIRADLYNTKVYKVGTGSNDTWNFLGQIHLWF